MEIWIGRDGERHGPYKEDDIRQWLRSGQVSRDDLAWYEGLADWQPLSVLFPDEVRNAPPTADNSHAAPTAPLQALPQTTAAALEDYAGFWKRFGAWLIDYVILLIPTVLIFMSTGAMDAFMQYWVQVKSGTSPEVAAVALKSTMLVPGIIVGVMGFVYYILFEGSKWQATPGKLALGIRVTDSDGGAIGMRRSVVRNAVRLINIIQIPFIGLIPFVSYIVTAWTPHKQGLHDMLAKALVLNGRASEFKSTPTASNSNNSFSA
ncbi:MAG: RDD family protein [Rhodanobacter sp.]